VSRARALVVLVAVALAVVLAGVGLYADGQPAEPVKVRDQLVGERQPGDPGYRPVPAICDEPGRRLTAEQEFACYARPAANRIYEPVYDDAPLAVLRSGAAPWWWFGAGAVLVLGAAALPLVGRRR
jgi:hypothetical protein